MLGYWLTKGISVTRQRSWRLNFSVCVLFIIGGLCALVSVEGVMMLWLFESLQVSFTSRTEIMSLLQHIAANSAFEFFMAIAFVISGFGCLKRRRYQGRFLGTACALVLFVLDFVNIYVLGHYDIGLFIAMMAGLFIVCILNTTCRNELTLSGETPAATP